MPSVAAITIVNLVRATLMPERCGLIAADTKQIEMPAVYEQHDHADDCVWKHQPHISPRRVRQTSRDPAEDFPEHLQVALQEECLHGRSEGDYGDTRQNERDSRAITPESCSHGVGHHHARDGDDERCGRDRVDGPRRRHPAANGERKSRS